MDWFSYDPEDGVRFHATEAEARDAAQYALDSARDYTGGEWPEDMEAICYGRIVGRVVETEHRAATEEDGIPLDWEFVAYALKEIDDAD